MSWYLIMLYLMFMLLLAPGNLLSLDTYYYWEWSRHLDLSYYDGPPFIAYMIKGFRLIFGDTLLALSLVGVFTALIMSVLLYRTARLFLTPKTSVTVVALWLCSPLTTLDLFKQTTYDTPLLLFWASALYATSLYLNQSKPRYLYALGLSLGLLLLSKYTGVILVLGLCLYTFITPKRALWRDKHFFGAITIAFLCIMPVLIWNHMHHWQSVVYQLTTHRLSHTVASLHNFAWVLVSMVIPALNIMLWFGLYPFFMSKHKPYLLLYLMISITTLSFCLIAAFNSSIRVYWLTPFLLTAALQAGAYVERYTTSQRFIKGLCWVYALISLGIMLNNQQWLQITTPRKFIDVQLIKQFNQIMPDLPYPVVTSGWLEARMLFFLRQKPAVYTLGCGSPQNQYLAWSAPLMADIGTHRVRDIIFIDPYDRKMCLKQYFKICTQLPTPVYRHHQRFYRLYAYHCSNPI